MGSFAACLIITAGAFSLDGTRFFRLPRGFLKPLESLVRVRVLSKLTELGLLNDRRCRMLMGWRHSGFSAFAGRQIAPEDDARLERLARYVRRPHLAGSKVIYDEGSDRVVFRSANGVT